ncbi:UNVERIFIED_CONTAM: hypothetical protein FKN15_067680 [Acipenser sinensis]
MKGCLFVVLWCCLAGWCLSSFPLDCEDVYTAGNFYSGVYKIYPAGGPGFPLYVYCDMYTDGGVWTVSHQTIGYMWQNMIVKGDSLSSHSGRKFSTFDRDQDGAGFNCAMEFRGAFWYHDCHSANLNGVYYQGNSTLHGKGIHWVTWRGLDYSLKGVEMKIRVLTKKPLKE